LNASWNNHDTLISYIPTLYMDRVLWVRIPLPSLSFMFFHPKAIAVFTLWQLKQPMPPTISGALERVTIRLPIIKRTYQADRPGGRGIIAQIDRVCGNGLRCWCKAGQTEFIVPVLGGLGR
jgi:hypothetical protein